MKRRFVLDPETQELIEVALDYTGGVRSNPGVYHENSYHNLQAQDGTDISSKTKHRRYMKEHNLTLAEDFKDTWAKAARERESFYKGENVAINRERTEDVARAYYALKYNSHRRGR